MNPTDGVWWQVRGEGPTILLVHGTMDRSASFGRISRLLTSWRVGRYDRRGYGRSLELGPALSYRQQVDDLLGVIDKIADGGEAPLVFGHSMGGTIALGAAAAAPDAISGVIAYESPMPWAEWWPADSAGAAAAASAASPEDAAERFMRRVVGDERWLRLPPSTRTTRRAEGPTMVAELGQVRPPNDPGFDLADVTVPLLAVHGTEGAPHHPRSAREMARLAPLGRLRVAEGASHGIHLSDPRAIVGFIEELAGTTADT